MGTVNNRLERTQATDRDVGSTGAYLFKFLPPPQTNYSKYNVGWYGGLFAACRKVRYTGIFVSPGHTTSYQLRHAYTLSAVGGSGSRSCQGPRIMDDCRADNQNASHRRKSVPIIYHRHTVRRVVSRDSATTRGHASSTFSL
jgi:hypothetical protein